MTTIRQLRPGSDEFEAALRGMVRAERINDVHAKPGTKSHDEYLRLIQDQFCGEPVTDPADAYRENEDRLAVIGRALRMYRDRDGTTVKGGLVYLHDELPIACAPHAVEADLVVLQVHVRQTLQSFEREVERGITPELYRTSIAQMAVSGLRYALQINYFEDGATQELVDHEVNYSRGRAENLLDEMIQFAARSRFRAAAENAA